MTKICCISDTHFKHDTVKIPECDILIHAGDFCQSGQYSEMLRFAQWIKTQPAKYIIIIAGNHDLVCEKMYYAAKLTFSGVECGGYGRINYLENQEIIIENIKIFGSPYTPQFNNWAFMLPRGELYDNVWSKIPDDTEILITHGPQYNVADLLSRVYPSNGCDTRVGCEELARRVSELKKLKLHICGHIHSGYGVYSNEKYTTINAAICNDVYQPMNKPIIYTLEES